MIFKAPIFDVKNLSFSVRGQDILTNISLEIFNAEYIAIIGPNGGGKTTLIRMLLGLDKPTSGDIHLFGKKLENFKEWYKIGYVPQRASHVDQNFPATALDIVKMGRTSKRGLFSRESQEDKEAVNSAMSKMNILDLKDKMVGTLSGGQRQRVMIARALASNPEILILDEPNTGVDMASQKSFYKLLQKLNK
ncbi:MAG: zinc ABC transporter ATP-binding protein, partial [Epsilonproteobacteria bacterium]